MQKLLEQITTEVAKAFEACEYSADFARVSISNRPDLCEYQCNGAMAAAKTYHKAPIQIANGVVEQLKENPMFLEASAVNPGFIKSEAGSRLPCFVPFSDVGGGESWL